MPPIYIMAAITLALGAGLGGGLVYLMSGRRRSVLWLLAAGLPLSALVNLVVKRPLVLWLGEVGGVEPNLGLATPLWFIVAVALVPPVTEEAIKALPLLLPAVRRHISDLSSALSTGMALGISFGLGEAAYLAYNVARAPAYAGYPWYAFTGYLGERLAVMLAHGLLTALFVAGIWAGRWQAAAGYLGAVLLHLLINAGAILASLELISPAAASLSLLAGLAILAILFERLRATATRSGEGKDGAEEVVYFRRDRER